MAGHTSRAGPLVLLVAALAVLGLVAAGGAVAAAGSADAVPGDAADAPPDPPDGNATADAADRLDCTNGTSPAVVACGPHPGNSAVSLSAQGTTGTSVTVEAADLREGGFVAVHAVSVADGRFTESVLGVSDYREAGLHRDVTVSLDRRPPGVGAVTLVAVAYRDTDGDGRFDFAATGGADDRPYTVTYTAEGGHVTDEAGDVVGDAATVTVRPPAVARFDADGDGDIGLAELSTAARAYADGDIDMAALGAVARAYADASRGAGGGR